MEDKLTPAKHKAEELRKYTGQKPTQLETAKNQQQKVEMKDMEYIKLQNKIKSKWIGMKAVTKNEEFFGKTGVIENVKLQPVIDRADEYTLHYVINCGPYKIVSPEDKTVIMLDSQSANRIQ